MSAPPLVDRRRGLRSPVERREEHGARFLADGKGVHGRYENAIAALERPDANRKRPRGIGSLRDREDQPGTRARIEGARDLGSHDEHHAMATQGERSLHVAFGQRLSVDLEERLWSSDSLAPPGREQNRTEPRLGRHRDFCQAINSAAMATAISSGRRARMSIPIGMRTRVRSSTENPLASSRSRVR